MKIAVSGKGGVGKTTFSSFLIKALAESGKKVLAIDADPDANLAQALGVEKDAEIHKIIEAGFEEEVVKKVIQLVDHSEYKRRQGPPGIKITPKAFGKDRRMPITNHYQWE